MRFHGKKILVTGAASGIGRATAIRLASEGAQVTIGDINEAGLAETAEMMASTPRICPFAASDTASCCALVAAAATDGLVVLCPISCVLYWGAQPRITSSMYYERLLTVHTTSVLALCQSAQPHLHRPKPTRLHTPPN